MWKWEDRRVEEGHGQKVLGKENKDWKAGLQAVSLQRHERAFPTCGWSQFCTSDNPSFAALESLPYTQTLRAGKASVRIHKPGQPQGTGDPSPNLTSSPEVSTSSFINKAKYKRTRPPNDPCG